MGKGDIRSIPIDELKPDRRNANKGTERGRKLLEHSIEHLGAGRSILSDRNDNIIAGNKTLEVAAEKGLPIQVVETYGDTLVVVKRMDLDLYDAEDTRGRELAYADNRVSEVDYQVDEQMLAQDFRDEKVDLSWMYSDLEMEQILRLDKLASMENGEDGYSDDEVDISEADALREKWGTEVGQLWQVGRHRLLCGDSTNPGDVSRLLNGAMPNLMVTDPPYGINYDAKWRNERAAMLQIGFAARREEPVTNDDRIDWYDAFALFPGNVAYVWHSSMSPEVCKENLERAGFVARNQIIWAKTNFVISRGNYHWKHESCWYAVRKGESADWIGDHSQTTLWEISWDSDVEGGHSTQKPIECMMRPLINHAGDVYEPFCGTGTTLVAAERMERTCYAMEIAPEYVAITLERAFTMGMKPELINER